MSLRPVVWSVMFELARFGFAMGLKWKCSSCATYLIQSWAKMSVRHPYVSLHCMVLNVLATFASSIVRILMEPKVGCPTIFVKVASPKVVFTIEVIDYVVLLGIFSLFRCLASSGSFCIGYRLFRSGV